MGSNLADLSDIARAEVSKVSFPKDAMVVFAALLFLNVKVAKYIMATDGGIFAHRLVKKQQRVKVVDC